MPIQPPVVGLLGGIGSGKSTVAAEFAKLGAFVIDADAIARQVVQFDEIKKAIADKLGSSAISEKGSLNREWIARQVFNDPLQRDSLNQIVHPPVRKIIENELERLGVLDAKSSDETPPANDQLPKVPMIILDVPLLLESPLRRYVNIYIYVETSEATRLKRVRDNRGWSEQELRAREATQASLTEKRNAATFVILNEGVRPDRAPGQEPGQLPRQEQELTQESNEADRELRSSVISIWKELTGRERAPRS